MSSIAVHSASRSAVSITSLRSFHALILSTVAAITASFAGRYRSHLFYAAGEDYDGTGCTLVTSLEPCPMCAATLLVSRMKRVAYVIEDRKCGGGWGLLKALYPSYQLRYECARRSSGAGLLGKLAPLVEGIDRAIAQLRGKVQDTWLLDRLHPQLAELVALLAAPRPSDLQSTGTELEIHARTLPDLQRLCRLPVA